MVSYLTNKYDYKESEDTVDCDEITKKVFDDWLVY